MILVLWPTLGVRAQSAPPTQKRQTPDTYPPALPHREGPPPPALTFVQLSEIPLPGPVSTEATRLEDGTIRLPVREGWAVLALEPELSVQIVDVDPRTNADDGQLRPAWVVSHDGRFRYTTLPEGMVRAERHRAKGWKKARAGKAFRRVFTEFGGASLKKAPRGFPPEHPLVEDLRRKDFAVFAHLKPAVVTEATFLDQVARSYKSATPFMRFLCDALELPF